MPTAANRTRICSRTVALSSDPPHISRIHRSGHSVEEEEHGYVVKTSLDKGTLLSRNQNCFRGDIQGGQPAVFHNRHRGVALLHHFTRATTDRPLSTHLEAQALENVGSNGCDTAHFDKTPNVKRLPSALSQSPCPS